MGAAVLFIPFASSEMALGNIHLLLALAIAVGFRSPATWAAVLLTKPTLGVCLLWFLLRGDWRRLGIALGYRPAWSPSHWPWPRTCSSSTWTC